MKFIYADSLDYIDPLYDFVADRSAPGRRPYWDDQYAHEFLDPPPYHGVLVSRAIVGDGPVGGGKYTAAQAQRFRREGARAFLRLDTPRLAGMPVFGDCGAFAYHRADVPPYTPEDMLAFYDDAGFTHGCSVDHIIFEFDEANKVGLAGGNHEARRRFEITLENAEKFLSAARPLSSRFTPLGVIQGWSPGSMAEAGRRLCAMGYRYLAVGGTVPLKTPQIKACLRAIRDAIQGDVGLHVLGFAKADDIAGFRPFGITSFDTTSPLLRAFKDAKSNYYVRRADGRMDYYTAIRVPQAIENPKLQRLAKRGERRQEELIRLERRALDALRGYDRKELGMEEALDAVMDYDTPALLEDPGGTVSPNKVAELRARYARTLESRPWNHCGCAVCKQASIEVVIFRASNRNKRRGMHNLAVFKTLVDDLENMGANANYDQVDFFGRQGPPKPPKHGAVLCS
jgi:queuine/archaeosine tRNA-ribosyltransferase